MSSKLGVCNSFMGSSHKGKRTLCWINSVSAKSIANFSDFPHEQESVLLPGTQLKIINKTVDPYDKTVNIIEMDEIVMTRDGKYNTFKTLLILVNYIKFSFHAAI
jgi:hypothetical protein